MLKTREGRETSIASILAKNFTLNFLVIQLTELYLYLSLITEKQFMCNSIRRN